MNPEGLLLVDKPKGPTSHDIIAQLRRLSNMRRIGHAGTLDPLATGVLVVGVGRATRLLEYLSGQYKRYEAVVRFGQSTDTFDADGEIVAEKPVDLSFNVIQEAMAQFRGAIVQYAPPYSAVKRSGQPLYKLARRGLDVERPPREVIISHLEILAWQEPLLTLDITCSAGTYIRSLADDLGNALRCGGHITALRRTAAGSFTIDQTVPLNHMNVRNWTSFLLSMDAAVHDLPEVIFSKQDAERLLMGQRVAADEAVTAVSSGRAYADDGSFLGIVVLTNGVWHPHKMFPDNS